MHYCFLYISKISIDFLLFFSEVSVEVIKMAKWDLTSKIGPYLDRHLVFPLLEFLTVKVSLVNVEDKLFFLILNPFLCIYLGLTLTGSVLVYVFGPPRFPSGPSAAARIG